MIVGTLIGTVWGARQVEALRGRKLALIREEQDGRPTGRVVVAIDTLDAEAGRTVVVAFGSGARAAVDPAAGRRCLADAAVGQVWSTVKWPGLEGLKLLVVQPYEHAQLEGADGLPEADPDRDDGVVVVDTLDAGVGDTVVIAFGHAARVAIAPELAVGQAPPHPIDAAVVAVVDGLEVSGVQT